MKLYQDSNGNTHIEDGESTWYQGIALYQKDGQSFIAVTGYFDSEILEADTIYRIEPVETEHMGS